MASELIAEAITDYFGERCLDYAEGCPTCEAWAEYDRWNTFPAPAATDTGLETVGEVSTVRKSIAAFAGHMLSRQLKPGDLLCLRSQAEEILAAKDARVKELEETKAVIAADKKTLLDLAATNGDKVTALEVKLAAAEQFIQFCADGFFVTDDELRGAARAVLGGKPS